MSQPHLSDPRNPRGFSRTRRGAGHAPGCGAPAPDLVRSTTDAVAGDLALTPQLFRVMLVGLLVACLDVVLGWLANLGRGQRRASPQETGRRKRPPFRLDDVRALGELWPFGSYDLLKVCVGLVNVRPVPDLVMLAPAFAGRAVGLPRSPGSFSRFAAKGSSQDFVPAQSSATKELVAPFERPAG